MIVASLLLISIALVVNSKKLINSLFFLIISIILTSCLFIMLKSDFVAFITIMVYVCALTILFMFVVMLIGFNDEEIKINKFTYIYYLLPLIFLNKKIIKINNLNVMQLSEKAIFSTKQIAARMYSGYHFEIAIMGILLMVSSIFIIDIIITRKKYSTKQQKMFAQATALRKVTMVDIKYNDGLQDNDLD